jgi:hypothetical protein
LKALLVGTLYEEEELDVNKHYFERIVFCIPFGKAKRPLIGQG